MLKSYKLKKRKILVKISNLQRNFPTLKIKFNHQFFFKIFTKNSINFTLTSTSKSSFEHVHHQGKFLPFENGFVKLPWKKVTLSLVYFSKNADEFHRIEVVVMKMMKNFAAKVILPRKSFILPLISSFMISLSIWSY